MTKNEAARILAVIAAAYPRFQVDSEGLTLSVWHEMLGDLDYKLVQIAVQKLILESPFPPTISDVRKQVVEIIQDPDDNVDGASAWGEVVQAIRNYGYYRTEEALNSLSPRVRKVASMIGWREICTCEEPGVVRGQFIKMYETYAAREKQDALLPNRLREQIYAIGSGENRLRLIKSDSDKNKRFGKQGEIIRGLMEGKSNVE